MDKREAVKTKGDSLEGPKREKTCLTTMSFEFISHLIGRHCGEERILAN